jgi:HD-GYP domain-containing protein (c-di-GMP phosphodiesterase class II)
MEIPYCHHERWDGSGYPRGLKREEIPLAARIFAVVDVWDALMTDRPYRKAWSEAQVVQYLREKSGTLFDPSAVNAFFKAAVLTPAVEQSRPSFADGLGGQFPALETCQAR